MNDRNEILLGRISWIERPRRGRRHSGNVIRRRIVHDDGVSRTGVDVYRRCRCGDGPDVLVDGPKNGRATRGFGDREGRRSVAPGTEELRSERGRSRYVLDRAAKSPPGFFIISRIPACARAPLTFDVLGRSGVALGAAPEPDAEDGGKGK